MTDALAGLKDKLASQEAEPLVDPTPVDPEPEAPVEEEEVFQQYSSSRISTCFITRHGTRVNFANYEYYTKDPEVIAYLDMEIAAGSRAIKKGAVVTKADLNPMAALKRKHIAEFKASQEGRDFGDTKPEAQRINTLTTDQVAN